MVVTPTGCHLVLYQYERSSFAPHSMLTRRFYVAAPARGKNSPKTATRRRFSDFWRYGVTGNRHARRDEDVVHLPQRAVSRQRLGSGHVEPGAGELARAARREQVRRTTQAPRAMLTGVVTITKSELPGNSGLTPVDTSTFPEPVGL